LSAYVQWGSPCCAALDYYAGWLYSVSGFREAVLEAQEHGLADFCILSGAYGIVYAEEFIHNYRKPLDAVYWRRHELPRVIAELIEATGVRRIYGFFAATTDYGKVLGDVNWPAIGRSTNLETAVMFSPIADAGSGAQRKVPTVLGEAILAFLSNALDPRAVLTRSWQGLTMREKRLYG
jgi:hypothetical protein